MIKGIGVSSGIAIGKVLKLECQELNIERTTIEDSEAELKKLYSAIEVSKTELTKIKDKAEAELGEEHAAIFSAHLMVLEDPEIENATKQKVEGEKLNVAAALYDVREQFVTIFESMDNEYMRERAADIKDVTDRILKHLLGMKITDLSSLEEEVIIIADDLTPSDTATMDKKKVVGFLTNIGGRTSHTAIMARSLEIPAIVGLKNITESVNEEDFIVFDGEAGEIIVNPSEEIVKEHEAKKEAFLQYKADLKTLTGQKSETVDGHHVELAANIGTPDDVEGVLNNDAEAVGLYRTEFLYMNASSLPSEEEQFEAYKKVVESMGGKPVVIRTLDIGGDKELSYMEMDKEMNPFLGYRAIRLCLDRTEIFRTQLRALLKASDFGTLRIMFPMISSLQELLDAKAILESCKAELKEEGIKFDDALQVGMMIEVPSAAVISDILAKEVDFFSIGTNDLIQYTCAVDRMNEKIHNLYSPFNPAVLRLVKMVIENAHKEGKWVGMCGEMAGEPKAIPVLLGLGLDEFSMSATSVLPARKLIRALSHKETVEIANKVVNMGNASEIEAYLESVIK